VNFRKDASSQDVADVFLYAYQMGCKGVTVYRDGAAKARLSRWAARPAESGQDRGRRAGRLHPRRGRSHPCATYKTRTAAATSTSTSMPTTRAVRCYADGQVGGLCAAQPKRVSRLVIAALRAGVDPHDISEQLRGIRCPIPTWEDGKMILSCADAIGTVLERALQIFPKPRWW